MRALPVSIHPCVPHPPPVPSARLVAATAAVVPCLVSLLAAGCAGSPGTRAHDAMVAALRDRERPASATAELASVMMAERALRDVELAVERTRAELDRRIATLDRLNGRIAGGGR